MAGDLVCPACGLGKVRRLLNHLFFECDSAACTSSFVEGVTSLGLNFTVGNPVPFKEWFLELTGFGFFGLFGIEWCLKESVMVNIEWNSIWSLLPQQWLGLSLSALSLLCIFSLNGGSCGRTFLMRYVRLMGKDSTNWNCALTDSLVLVSSGFAVYGVR
ncbi:hypothetical protein RHGRI_027298 [Rhododendron griersonianum]|uniref:Uncharacterized protein n=1 Tax=Rhododendron griersonianum TaxID=479676 RepID=A0AAV6J0E8_9ERIC|nr:hypothetical protein RHGRI_027298 [Rhododendron griersonianum]